MKGFVNKNSGTIIVLAVITGLLFYIGFAPGGRFFPVFLVMLLMFATAGYLGFISEKEIRKALLPKFATVILFATTGWVAWVLHLEQSGIKAISQFITPYPNISKIIRIPAVSDCQLQHWQLITEDPVDKIFQFYDDEKNRHGWQLKKAGNFILLNKDKYELVILTAEIHGGSDIFYRLAKKKCKPVTSSP